MDVDCYIKIYILQGSRFDQVLGGFDNSPRKVATGNLGWIEMERTRDGLQRAKGKRKSSGQCWLITVE